MFHARSGRGCQRPARPLTLARSLCGGLRGLSVALIFAAAPSYADATEEDGGHRRFYTTVGMGIDFSRGDYGERDPDPDSNKKIYTNNLTIPLFVKLEFEPLTFRLSLPLLGIDGSENVIGFGDSTGRDEDGSGERSQRFGLGDVITSLTYTYYPGTESWIPVVDLQTKVKIPTASSGLGTGHTDVTLQAELSKTFGIVSPFGAFGYRFNGGRRDSLRSSAGIGLRFTRWFSVTGAYDWRESSTSNSDSHEVSALLGFRVGRHTRLNLYGVKGLSNSTADWGLGTSVSYEF